MPWQTKSLMDERLRFVALASLKHTSFTELAELFGISRKTGYKWLTRYKRLGADGCLESSRAPRNSPQSF